MEIKDILYDIINEMGIKNIRFLLNNDIRNSKDIIKNLYKNFDSSLKDRDIILNYISSIPKSERISNSNDEFEKIFVASSEALLHFLLTAAVIPSERKISYKNTELDIVIPNLRVLKTNPSKAIVMLFDKENLNNTKMKINEIKKGNSLNWSLSNLWLVSFSHRFFDCKNYVLENVIKSPTSIIAVKERSSFNFDNILVDVVSFLKFTNDKSMKILSV